MLVTGGAGFVGRWLCRALQPAGSEIHILDLMRGSQLDTALSFHQADLCRLEDITALIAKVRPSVVIHLAGQPGVAASHDNPHGAFESNVLATFNLLEACRAARCADAVVAVSSNHVYGEQHSQPTAEQAPLNGHGVYAATKLAADVLARTFGKSYGLPVGIARITNSYGGDDHHLSHIVTATILSALKKESPVIKQSGRDRKGYSYIKDTVTGLLAIAEGVAASPRLSGEAFNIAPDQSITVIDLVQLVLKTVGSRLEPRVLQPAAPFEEEFLDNRRAANELSWRPAYSYEEGLAETVRWYHESSTSSSGNHA